MSTPRNCRAFFIYIIFVPFNTWSLGSWRSARLPVSMSVRGPLRKKTLAGIRGVNSSPGCTRAGAERGDSRRGDSGRGDSGEPGVLRNHALRGCPLRDAPPQLQDGRDCPGPVPPPLETHPPRGVQTPVHGSRGESARPRSRSSK